MDLLGTRQVLDAILIVGDKLDSLDDVGAQVQEMHEPLEKIGEQLERIADVMVARAHADGIYTS